MGIVSMLTVSGVVQGNRSVVDDAGVTITLEQPAVRIISLAPHITELLYAAGAGSHIVGVDVFSDHPDAAKELPRIGDFNAFDLEAILALQPDLIIAWQSGNPLTSVSKMQSLGIPVFFSEPRKLEDIASNIKQFGKLAGTEVVANQIAEDYLRQLSELRAKYQGRYPVSVFYQIWHQPLMTINGEHIISHVIELCGGRNIFSELSVLAPSVDLEAVLVSDPALIVAGGVAASYPAWKQDWLRWPQLRAVKTGSFLEVDPDLLQRHTPRILQGAKTLCVKIDDIRKHGGNKRESLISNH